MEPKNEELLTATEVAKQLRVHTFTVHMWARTKQLRALRVGRGWRFRQSDIEKFLQEGATKKAA